MISRFGLYIDLMNETCCGSKVIIKMPEDLLRRIAVGYLRYNSCKFSLLITGDEYFYSGDRIYKFHHLDDFADTYSLELPAAGLYIQDVFSCKNIPLQEEEQTMGCL